MFVFLQLNSPNYWQGCYRKIFLTVLDSCCRLHCYYCYYYCYCCSSCCWCCSGCWRWCWGWSGRRQRRMRWRSSPARTLGWCPAVPPSERSVRHSGLGTEVVSTSVWAYCVSTCPSQSSHNVTYFIQNAQSTPVLILRDMFPLVLSRCHIFEEKLNFSHN